MAADLVGRIGVVGELCDLEITSVRNNRELRRGLYAEPFGAPGVDRLEDASDARVVERVPERGNHLFDPGSGHRECCGISETLGADLLERLHDRIRRWKPLGDLGRIDVVEGSTSSMVFYGDTPEHCIPGEDLDILDNLSASTVAECESTVGVRLTNTQRHILGEPSRKRFLGAYTGLMRTTICDLRHLLLE